MQMSATSVVVQEQQPQASALMPGCRAVSPKAACSGGSLHASDDLLLNVGWHSLIPLQLHGVLCASLGHACMMPHTIRCLP